jgi:hypothetical protein
MAKPRGVYENEVPRFEALDEVVSYLGHRFHTGDRIVEVATTGATLARTPGQTWISELRWQPLCTLRRIP